MAAGGDKLAAAYGLRACWSMPIISSRGKVLGAFATYSHQPRGPSAEATQLIDLASHIAGIGIEREQSHEALRESEERLQIAVESGGMGIWDWDTRTNALRWIPLMKMAVENRGIPNINPAATK